jgi:hypothetical protein
MTMIKNKKIVFLSVLTGLVFRQTGLADTNPPAISLRGTNPASVICGSVYTDAGASVADNSGSAELITEIRVDAGRIGTGAVVYRAMDAASNITVAVRDVQVLPAPDGSSRLTNSITVPATFPDHPRLILNQSELEVIKARIAAKQQPHLSVWSNLSKQCAAVYTAIPYTGTVPGTFTDRAQTEGGKALDYALVYRLGGQTVHADRAVAILAAWAQTVPLPGTALVDEAGTGSGMFVSRGVFPMIYAADLLWDYPGFDGSPKAAFITWMQAMVPLIEESIAAWEANDYFTKQYYQNHLVAHALGLASIGIFLGDPVMVQRAYDSAGNPRDYRELIAGTILMPGDAVCIRETSTNPGKVPPGGWPGPAAGEIYDRYRHHTAPLRGLQYGYLSLSLLSTMAETSRHLGLDLWRTAAPGGENLLLSHEYYSDFYRLKDARIKSGFYAMGGPYTLNDYTGSDETHRLGLAGDSGAIFELGGARFPISLQLCDVLRSSTRTAWRDPLLGPVTLTHGIPDEVLSARSGWLFMLLSK